MLCLATLVLAILNCCTFIKSDSSSLPQDTSKVTLVKRSSNRTVPKPPYMVDDEMPSMVDAVELSNLDWQEAVQEPYGLWIDASHWSDLIAKAVLSAEKDKIFPLYESDIIGPSASKWLTRIEASIRKDHEMIHDIHNYYNNKANRMPSNAARARAIAKGEMWLARLEKEDEIKESTIDEIDHAGERYEKLATKLRKEFLKAKSSHQAKELLDEIDAKYQQALAMKTFWESGANDLYTARMYAQMELRNVNEAWVRQEREREDPNLAAWEETPAGVVAWDCLSKALAWNARVRQLKLEKQARKLAKKLKQKANISRGS